MEQPLCAITGAHGYVGGRIAARFAARGWRVRNLVRRPSGPDDVLFRLGEAPAPGALDGVSCLVHAAYDFAPLDGEGAHRANVEGTRLLFEAARKAEVPRSVLISSMSAFDGCRSVYGQTKLSAEAPARTHGALVVRPGVVYGNRPGGMCGNLAKQAAKGGLQPMVGGDQPLHLVHEEDLSDMIERYAAGAFAAPGHPVTAAHPKPWTLKEIVFGIAKALGRRPPRFVPLPWRAVWLGIRTAEALGLRLAFRSDSLVSLMHVNPRPDFSTAGLPIAFRPFEPEKIDFGLPQLSKR